MICSPDERPIDATDILDKLKRLSSAEDFFATLGVAYEEAVLRVARLHILKRMGQYLGSDDLDGLPGSVVAARVKATLQRAYADFERSSGSTKLRRCRRRDERNAATSSCRVPDSAASQIVVRRRPISRNSGYYSHL